MLKIILLGYAHGLISSRRIAKACETNILFINVSGELTLYKKKQTLNLKINLVAYFC
uniref:transposase n=1 Tax=Pseudoalteromonas fuliginea TaxID=1872678 RepID=UPI001E5DF890|nr:MULTISPECIES: transposase [Pseudoalteromonas]